MRTLILLRGLPGSGKSSFAIFLWDRHVVCEADKYFYDKEGNYNFDATKLGAAHKWCQEQCEMFMQDNQANSQFYPEIIVSNTSTTESELKPYLDLAAKYDYKVVSLIVENRHGNKSIHGVPDETMEKMKNRFSIKLISIGILMIIMGISCNNKPADKPTPPPAAVQQPAPEPELPRVPAHWIVPEVMISGEIVAGDAQDEDCIDNYLVIKKMDGTQVIVNDIDWSTWKAVEVGDFIN